ncbi:Fur family transcriptional regulator, partial [Thiolapillus sp.]
KIATLFHPKIYGGTMLLTLNSRTITTSRKLPCCQVEIRTQCYSRDHLMNSVSTDNRQKNIRQHLAGAGIYATPQRQAIAELLFSRHQHLTADQVYERMRSSSNRVSRATVYNTLNLFVEKGLLREIFVDASRTFYDSNVTSHYHFYNIDTGGLIDMNDQDVTHYFSKSLPMGTVLEGIDVVVRVRSSAG